VLYDEYGQPVVGQQNRWITRQKLMLFLLFLLPIIAYALGRFSNFAGSEGLVELIAKQWSAAVWAPVNAAAVVAGAAIISAVAIPVAMVVCLEKRKGTKNSEQKKEK
jgi:fatty acid desaturase